MLLRSASALVGLCLLGVTAGSAAAAPFGAISGIGRETAAQPAAMCGYSCRSGGRYIPGPPSVCYEEGLRYCGSSRDRGPPPYVERRRDRYYDDGPRRGFYYR